MTSLNAPGFSVSLLNVTNIQNCLRDNTKTTYHVNLSELLDAPTDALAWIGVRSHWPQRGSRDLLDESREGERFLASFNRPSISSSTKQISFWRAADISPESVKKGILGSCTAVLIAESELTRCDTIVGDGDCGATFTAGAKGKFL